MKKNEVDYYPEIMSFIEEQLKSNFLSRKIKDVHIFWKSGELKTKIRELITDYPSLCGCIESYCNTVSPLNLDIFAVITNGLHFEVLILEVKLVKAVGLSEWSQLVGYNLVSGAGFGLLINIDSGASPRLSDILAMEEDVSSITRIKRNGEQILHELGFMQWNSVTKNFEYSNLGCICSLSELSRKIAEKFND